MPKITEYVADYARSYECHGLDFQQAVQDQLIAECLFCGDNKFYVNRFTGQANCFKCWPGGNLYLFLRKLWDQLNETRYDHRELIERRGFLRPDTCKKWGIVKGLMGNWLAPGYNSEGNIVQLYRYINLQGKYRFLPTPMPEGDGHGIYRMTAQPTMKKVFICEGLWDAMALSEIVTDHEIWAVPGCKIFQASWANLFSGKDVTLLYHNDYPDKNGNIAALQGLEKAVRTLATCLKPPKSISCLRWGHSHGYVDETLPPGYDLNDILRKESTLGARKKSFTALLQRLVEPPREWKVRKVALLKPTATDTYEKVRESFQKAMHWSKDYEELDYGTIIALATVLSTATQGDQVWLRFIGPPSSGKSTLCEAISTADKFIYATSTLKGLYSGYRTTADDSEDNSLIAKLNGKTLVIKDGDTLMASPDLPQIMSHLRDAYDGSSRTHYNNKMGKKYDGHRFTVIISGTKNIRNLDRSERGERFIDCEVIKSVGQQTQRTIGLSIVKRALTEGKSLVNGCPESLMTPEMVDARKRTAGFIEYLRDKAESIIGEVSSNLTEETQGLLYDWADFTSFMRVKLPIENRWTPTPDAVKELPYRLTSQFTRLALSIAGVLGKNTIDSTVLGLTKKVVLDTCEGPVLQVSKKLYETGASGLEAGMAAVVLKKSPGDASSLLRFLSEIELVNFVPNTNHTAKWKLTQRVRELYNIVMNEE